MNEARRFFGAFLSAFFLFSSVAVSVANAAAEQPPTNAFQQSYTQGINALREKRYGDAVSSFQQAHQLQKSHLNTLKYLCFSAFKTKDYTLTIEAAEKFLALKTDAEVKAMKANALLVLGKNTEARTLYLEVFNEASGALVTRSEQAIKAIDLQNKNTSRPGYFSPAQGLSGYVLTSLQHNSNVTNGVNREQFSSISDDLLSLSFGANYDVLAESFDYYGVGFAGFANQHADRAKDYDLHYAQINLHVGWVASDWSLKLAYEQDRVAFDYQRALDTHRLRATYFYVFNPKHLSIVIPSVAGNDYSNNDGQDATQWRLSWRYRYYPQTLSTAYYYKLRYLAVVNRARNEDRYSYTRHGLRAGLRLPLRGKFYLDSDIELQSKTYAHFRPAKRRDDIWKTSFGIGYNWSRQVSSEIFYRFSSVDSSEQQFDSNQHITGVELNYSF